MLALKGFRTLLCLKIICSTYGTQDSFNLPPTPPPLHVLSTPPCCSDTNKPPQHWPLQPHPVPHNRRLQALTCAMFPPSPSCPPPASASLCSSPTKSLTISACHLQPRPLHINGPRSSRATLLPAWSLGLSTDWRMDRRQPALNNVLHGAGPGPPKHRRVKHGTGRARCTQAFHLVNEGMEEENTTGNPWFPSPE